MRKRYIGHALLLAAAILPRTVLAQTGTGTALSEAALPSRSCELHVWPSGGLRSVYHGWFHGGIVDGAVRGRDGYPRVPENPLDTAVQDRLLGEIDLPETLRLQNFTTILHDAALDSRTIRTGTARLMDSTAPCYAELIVDDVFLQQDGVNGSFLKTLFRFRDFGGAATPERSFGTWAKTGLHQFPPQKPEAVSAGLAELEAAYQQNVVVFAGYLNKPVKKRK